jgi:hypothetical protein
MVPGTARWTRDSDDGVPAAEFGRCNGYIAVRNVRRLTWPPLSRVLFTSFIASTAYLGMMMIDMRVTRNRYNDLVFWGGYGSRVPRRQRIIGIALIYTVGSVVTAVYGALLPLLPRWPGWLLGACFVQTENIVRFPTVVPMNAVHPSVRSGELPPLWTWRYFWLEADRHIAFGLVLGLLMRRRA